MVSFAQTCHPVKDPTFAKRGLINAEAVQSAKFLSCFFIIAKTLSVRNVTNTIVGEFSCSRHICTDRSEDQARRRRVKYVSSLQCPRKSSCVQVIRSSQPLKIAGVGACLFLLLGLCIGVAGSRLCPMCKGLAQRTDMSKMKELRGCSFMSICSSGQRISVIANTHTHVQARTHAHTHGYK